MKNKLLIPVVALIGLFSLLAGWMSPQGQSASVPSLMRTDNSKKLTIQTKKYTPEESKKYLSRDLLSRGYQPIQVTIHNNTSSTITIEDIDTPQARAGEVARKISSEVLPRRAGYTIAGLLFWPFIVPSAIDGFKNLQNYSKMKRDFAARSVKLETIAPFSTLDRILFVPCDEVKETLTITMYDQFTGKMQEYKTEIS